MGRDEDERDESSRGGPPAGSLGCTADDVLLRAPRREARDGRWSSAGARGSERVEMAVDSAVYAGGQVQWGRGGSACVPRICRRGGVGSPRLVWSQHSPSTRLALPCMYSSLLSTSKSIDASRRPSDDHLRCEGTQSSTWAMSS